MTGSNQPASGRSRTAITYARVGDLGIALLGGGCFVSFGMVVVFYQTRVVRNKEPTTNQNHYLTGKAPYRFESAFLQQRVACEPDIFMRSRGSADHKRKRTQQRPEPWSGMTNLTPARDRRVPWGGITTLSTAVRVRLTGSVSLLVALFREKKAQEEGRHRCLNYTTVLWLTFNGDNPAQGK
jgi:hypothetical protein